LRELALDAPEQRQTVLNSARESNGGPAIWSEDAGAIRSALSGEESEAWAESRERGSTPEDAGGSSARSSVARPDRVAVIEDAIAAIDAGRFGAARELLVAFVAAVR